jgi:recombination protein RecT
MTQVQTPPKSSGLSDLRGLLDKSKQHIAMALPKHLTAERMIRVAIAAYMQTPKLQECSPLSIVHCVVQSSQLGLELTGPLGEAYMVPYYNKDTRQREAQFQVGYRGFLSLAYRSGKVRTFCARVAYTNDVFRYTLGTDPKIHHVPAEGDQGDVRYFYSVLMLKGGGVDFEVMSKAAVDAHRMKYSKQREDGAFNPWNTAYEEMGKKTLIRKLAKRAPMSVELVTAAVQDEYVEAGVPLSLPAVTHVDGEKLTLRDSAANSANGAALSAEPVGLPAADDPQPGTRPTREAAAAHLAPAADQGRPEIRHGQQHPDMPAPAEKAKIKPSLVKSIMSEFRRHNIEGAARDKMILEVTMAHPLDQATQERGEILLETLREIQEGAKKEAGDSLNF